MELHPLLLFQSASTYMIVLRYLITISGFILTLNNCDGSIIVSDYSKIKQDSNLVTSHPVKVTRSLLECSQYCTSTGNCCGLNYHKIEKTCICLYAQDFVNPSFANENYMAIYIHKQCIHLYEIPSSTNSATAAKTTSREATTTKKKSSTKPINIPTTTTKTTTALATTTAHTKSTIISIQTTTATTTNAQTTTKAPTIVTTTQTTNLPTTKITNAPIITTTIANAPATITTTIANAPTTTSITTTTTVKSTSQCVADALLCLTNIIYLFSDNNVYTYDTINDITVGAKNSQNVSEVFHSTRNNVIGAYSDSDSIYLFTGNNEVHLYSSASSSSFHFQRTVTWSEHFGTSDITSIDDVIYTSSGEQYVISGDKMYIISGNGKVETSPLDNNGNNNVYRSDNFSERPVSITGACAIDTLTHAFTDSSLFLFDFETRKWTKYSSIIC